MIPQSELSPAPVSSTDYNLLSPNLSDILNDDQVLKFYQCVKEIRAQQSPAKTAAMFFAFCHALNQQTKFLKVPNMNRLLFRQDEKCYAVDVAGTGQESVDALSEYCLDVMRLERSATDAFVQDAIGFTGRQHTMRSDSTHEVGAVSSSRNRAETSAKREGSATGNNDTSKKTRKASTQREYSERSEKMNKTNIFLYVCALNVKLFLLQKLEC